MFQLVYISSALEDIGAELLDSILTASRRNNERDGVTGLLVAGRRRFLQALEGPEQPVLETYTRIRHDPRHRSFVLLTGRGIAQRAFGSWSMACERGQEGPAAETLSETVNRLTESLSDKSLRARFVGFAEPQGRPA